MVHYVCTGKCGFVSYEPGVCQTEGCVKRFEPLVYCYCEDGKHNGKGAPEKDIYKP